jgi:hypothetical protein
LDIAALQSELDAFNDAALEGTATARDRARLEELYRDAALPDSIRGRAAFLVGSIFAMDGQHSEMCRWYRFGADRDPANANLRRALESPACRQ